MPPLFALPKAAALPAYCVSSGAGNTGCFSTKGKVSSWKTFAQVDEKEVLNKFAQRKFVQTRE